jgi:hypothetical protein
MSQTFYFANHTLKHLCSFNNDVSILTALHGALRSHTGWNTIHDIHVICHEHYLSVWETYVKGMGFMDLDMVPSILDSVSSPLPGITQCSYIV